MTQHPENCSWIYQARRVNSQTAGGGGALAVRISIAAGQVARIIRLYAEGPATNTTLQVRMYDEDSAAGVLIINNAAAATNYASIPNAGSAGTASGSVATGKDMIIASGEYLVVTAAAAANTETLTVAVVLELFNSPTAPTWDTTGSGGTPSLAASTISAANTLVAGRMWT